MRSPQLLVKSEHSNKMLKWTLYLLYFVSYSKANLCGQYRIPKPTFTVYNPQGLEVSIPDENGINLVIFYISVNKGLSESEADYTEYVVNQVNGRWTFSKDTIKLAVGDIVYHKIYVQRYRRGYLYRGTPYVVTGRERVNWPKPVRPGHKPDDDCYEFPTTVPLPPTPSTTEASISNKVSTTELPTLNGATPLDCSLFSNTLLKILANTQQELDNLKNNQETILEMASVQPYNLRLSGLVTALGEPTEIVESVLLEKLNTNLKIKNASRSGTIITFELFSFEQKLDIYKKAKKYLKESKNIIISL